jgi:hypothetical protein
MLRIAVVDDENIYIEQITEDHSTGQSQES